MGKIINPHSMNNDLPCEACQSKQGCKIPAHQRLGKLDFEQWWWCTQAWQEKQFGTRRERGQGAALLHLQKELAETMERPSCNEEYVDMLFLVIEAHWRAGFNLQELIDGLNSKLKVNMSRTWPPVVPGQPCEHVRVTERGES